MTDREEPASRPQAGLGRAAPENGRLSEPGSVRLRETALPSPCSGLLVSKSADAYRVRTAEGRVIPCHISTALRRQLQGVDGPGRADPASRRRARWPSPVVDLVAVGDLVEVRELEEGTGLICGLAPRRNYLGRRAAGDRPMEQVIAANVDLALFVVAVSEPSPNWAFVDRLLLTAEGAGIPAALCLTKADLEPDPAMDAETATYASCGYGILSTSARTGLGLDHLRALLRGKVTVMAGASGAGKTSILNALQPGLGRKVAELSGRTGKGRHTTKHLEMHFLPDGGALIDTPGIRECGLWALQPESMGALFPDLRDHFGKCRVGFSCRHGEEPGCALREGVAAGRISARRLSSYLKLRDEAESWKRYEHRW